MFIYIDGVLILGSLLYRCLADQRWERKFLTETWFWTDQRREEKRSGRGDQNPGGWTHESGAKKSQGGG